MTPEELLAGPRGRGTCWWLFGLSHEYPHAFLESPPPGPLEPPQLDAQRVLAALSRSVDDAMYWQQPHDHDIALADPAWREALAPVAEALAASPLLDWWSAPLDRDAQIVIAFDDLDTRLPQTGEPIVPGQRARIDALAAEERETTANLARDQEQHDWRRMGAIWWSAPRTRPGPSTTPAIDSLGPVGLWLVEDEQGWSGATTWPIAVPSTARVFEIDGPDAWVELVREFPLDVSVSKRGDWWRTTGRDGRWVMPDWPAVAGDYDAVHLSVRGYLTCAGIALEVDDDTATLVAGWDPSATYWFDDLLDVSGPANRWTMSDDGSWRPGEA